MRGVLLNVSEPCSMFHLICDGNVTRMHDLSPISNTSSPNDGIAACPVDGGPAPRGDPPHPEQSRNEQEDAGPKLSFTEILQQLRRDLAVRYLADRKAACIQDCLAARF